MKVLFYSDMDVFGGHEAMAVHTANALAKHAQVFFAFHVPAYKAKLCADVVQMEAPTRTRRPFPYLQSYRGLGRKECRNLLFRIRPDVIIVVQGMIELCVDILQAERPPGARILSYIPLAQTMRETGAFMGSMRDRINKRIYASFDGFIAISPQQAELLVNYWKVGAPVFMLPNVYAGMKCFPFTLPDPRRYKILTAGRLDIQHKGLDRIPGIIMNLKERRIDFEWRIAGSGPGNNLIHNYLAKYKELAHVEWTSDMEAQYGWADVVAGLSRFEGISLVMLEAIASGKPFIGSDIASYRDYLPKDAIFRSDNEFADCLMRLFAQRTLMEEAFRAIQRRIMTEHSPERFTQNAQSLVEWLGSLK